MVVLASARSKDCPEAIHDVTPQGSTCRGKQGTSKSHKSTSSATDRVGSLTECAKYGNRPTDVLGPNIPIVTTVSKRQNKQAISDPNQTISSGTERFNLCDDHRVYKSSSVTVTIPYAPDERACEGNDPNAGQSDAYSEACTNGPSVASSRSQGLIMNLPSRETLLTDDVVRADDSNDYDEKVGERRRMMANANEKAKTELEAAALGDEYGDAMSSDFTDDGGDSDAVSDEWVC